MEIIEAINWSYVNICFYFQDSSWNYEINLALFFSHHFSNLSEGSVKALQSILSLLLARINRFMLIADINIKIPLSILLPQDFYCGWNSDTQSKKEFFYFIFLLRENLPCSTFSANVMKRSDCFQRLWSCCHAAAPEWNKWPWGDWGNGDHSS